jgi:monofunctional glycosyltransferase
MLRWFTRFLLLLTFFGAPVVLSRAPAPPQSWMWLGGLLLIGLAWLCLLVVLSLRWVNPPTTAFMLAAARRLKRRAFGTKLEYVWVPASSLPPHLLLAAIAGEDTYFALHEGFDWHSLRAAYLNNKSGGTLRGGSTISQQVAKNLFLWEGPSYLRKAIEACFTLLIEATWPKARILEIYLNIAQFGPQTFGIEGAARRFCSKSASRLTPQEAALLVAVLPGPTVYRADQPTHQVRFRQAMILASMKKLGPAYLARIHARRVEQPA